jgi:UDP-GlcNAc:undecaprenyl-phosphate/decaprenyl-phosphate GlcNAc-1-phosphate transferase
VTGYLVQYWVGFAIALLASLLLTRLVRERARTSGWVDQLEERKIHRRPVPRVGGVAVFFATAIAFIGLAIFTKAVHPQLSVTLGVILLGAVAMHLLGLYDDIRGLRARYKLAGQVTVALLVAWLAVPLEQVAIPVLGVFELSPFAAVLLGAVWLVGITNAVNLVDGMDGLAGGLSIIAFAALAVIALLNGQPSTAMVALIIAGATAGFLRYNVPPASIFLGDSGSLFVGFLLASLSILAAQIHTGAVIVAIPVLVLALPIADTALTIGRRLLRAQSILTADRGHIHHRLLAQGRTTVEVTLTLFGFAAMAAAAAVVVTLDGARVLPALIAIAAAGVYLISRLEFDEFKELGRLVGRAARPVDVIARNVRLREAAARLQKARSMEDVGAVLTEAFEADGLPRAQLWVCPQPRASGGMAELALAADSSVLCWQYSRNGRPSARSWEITLPLLSPGNAQLGSLVLWETGSGIMPSTSHLQVIADYLRPELERKMEILGAAAAVQQAAAAHLVPCDSGEYPAPLDTDPARAVGPVVDPAPARRIAGIHPGN